MATVLYIKANPKSDQESRTFQLSEQFIRAYQATHPGDRVIKLDLYKENIRPLTEAEVALTHRPTDTGHPMVKFAQQFNQADKYVLAAPMWNLGIPSILKAYIDYIMIVGVNFCYTAEGPSGMCRGKKAVHITTRGGNYSQGPYAAYEMGDRYLRTIFGFLGVIDFQTIAAEGLDVQGQDVPALMKAAADKAEAAAKGF